MATRGWNDVTADQIQQRAETQASVKKPAKYRNQRVIVDGQRFDSKREAAKWHELRMRERAGEIDQLERQVEVPLYAPCRTSEAIEPNMPIQVATYVADFRYRIVATGRRVCFDSKGVRTQVFILKSRWLLLQDGISIEEG